MAGVTDPSGEIAAEELTYPGRARPLVFTALLHVIFMWLPSLAMLYFVNAAPATSPARWLWVALAAAVMLASLAVLGAALACVAAGPFAMDREGLWRPRKGREGTLVRWSDVRDCPRGFLGERLTGANGKALAFYWSPGYEGMDAAIASRLNRSPGRGAAWPIVIANVGLMAAPLILASGIAHEVWGTTGLWVVGGTAGGIVLVIAFFLSPLSEPFQGHRGLDNIVLLGVIAVAAALVYPKWVEYRQGREAARAAEKTPAAAPSAPR